MISNAKLVTFIATTVVNKTEHLDFRKKHPAKPRSKYNFDPLLKCFVDIVSFAISRPLIE